MNPALSPIPALLDVFQTDLRDVRFGDVDATSLAAFAAHVDEAEQAVVRAQAVLDEARAEVAARHETLLAHAQRALAYARVYAAGHEALAARLAAISLPKPRRRNEESTAAPVAVAGEPASRPRGRPRKAPASAGTGAEGSAGAR